MTVQLVQQNVLRHVERRAAARFPVKLPVMVHFSGTSTAHMTRNFSTGGLLIRPTVDGPAIGAVVAIDIGVLASGVMTIVVGHRDQGTALQFMDPHEGERVALALSEQVQRAT
ncbi:PilZ domain-containing protein [Minwuia sp.]|uniref:PilZ domain-containing protein n=1 Tax=Minwuia sp. TaxID=2493630 RepID=UPI003A935CE1